jgi:hypothetical protein
VVLGDISLYRGRKLSALAVVAGAVLMIVAFRLAGYILFLFEGVVPDASFFIFHWVIVTSAFVVGYNVVGSWRRNKQGRVDVVQERGTGIEWAKSSFICGVSTWVAPLMTTGIVLIVVVALNFGGATPGGLASLSLKGITKDALVTAAIIMSTILSLGALVSGIVGWGKIRGKEGNLKAAGFVHNGLILGCLYLAVASGVFVSEVRSRRRVRAFKERHPKIAETFRQVESVPIYMQLMNYGNRHGEYPAPEKWNDILMGEDKYRSQRGYFDEELSKYAINPNTRPDSPADAVLLFETEKGWNKCGGRELMAFDDQDRCLVILNDGKMEVVSKQEIHKLNWGDEQKE